MTTYCCETYEDRGTHLTLGDIAVTETASFLVDSGGVCLYEVKHSLRAGAMYSFGLFTLFRPFVIALHALLFVIKLHFDAGGYCSRRYRRREEIKLIPVDRASDYCRPLARILVPRCSSSGYYYHNSVQALILCKQLKGERLTPA